MSSFDLIVKGKLLKTMLIAKVSKRDMIIFI